MPTRQHTNASANSRRSVSNTYKNIDRHASLRSSLSGTQKTASGEDSLVQKDEADPLGMAASVAAKLRSRGLPVEDNVKLRNRFMLSSTSFSPQMFLSQVHQDASTEELLQGLDFLSRSIEQKSASLKVLVESNFEKFVRAKATIDNVYTEMRTQGADPLEGSRPTTATRGPHSRQASRGHFRNSSNPFSPTNKPLPSDKKKNALTKESEYGVQGIKMPLLELAIKAEEVWGPALGGRDKEEGLKNILNSLDQHREIFSLSASVYEAMRKNDYDTIISDWKKAKKYADEARGAASMHRKATCHFPMGMSTKSFLLRACGMMCRHRLKHTSAMFGNDSKLRMGADLQRWPMRLTERPTWSLLVSCCSLVWMRTPFGIGSTAVIST